MRPFTLLKEVENKKNEAGCRFEMQEQLLILNPSPYFIKIRKLISQTCFAGYAKAVITMALVISGMIPSANSQEPQTENMVSADVTQGCAPFKVTFLHTVTNVTQFQWNFGDGTTSGMPSPVHVYHQPGTYSVSLTFLNNDGIKDSIVKQALIHVNESPVADFTLEKNGNCIADNQVVLHNLSQNAKNFIWDMGDGTTLNTNEPVYHYSKQGIFNITLVASDNLGCNSFKIMQSAVEIFPSTDADFSVSSFIVCDVSQPFKLFPENENEPEYLWNFGDGTVSNEQNPVKYFASPGSYLINLEVTNSYNCRTISQNPITVKISMPVVPEITSDVTSGCEPLIVNFTSDTENAIRFKWQFEGSDTLLGNSVYYEFNIANVFDVSLTAEDTNGCHFTKKIDDYVMVMPSPAAGFQSNLVQPCMPVQIQLTNTSIGATKFYWDFGDSSYSSEMDPSHIYTNPGSYTITLLAENGHGCTSQFTQSNPVNVVSGNVEYQIPPVSSGCVPMQINFSYNKEGVDHWLWDFGDGTSSQSPAPSYTYSEAGDYTVSLTLTMKGGCTVHIPEFSSYHIGGTKADFSINNVTICPPYSADLKNLTEHVVSWFWDFGDSTYSYEENPHHIYNKSGFYNVSLEITSEDGCKHSLQKINAVYFESTEADFYMTVTEGSYPKKVEFTSATTGNVTFEWDFGDGTFSNEKNPVHFYYQPGNFQVTLKITNSYGCVKIITQQLGEIEMGTGGVFGNVNAEFSTDEGGNQVLGCAPREVHFINQSSGAIIWQWDFGDSASSSLENPVHTYLFPGNYSIRLIAINHSGFPDTIIYQDFVKITGPVADYRFSYPSLCDMNMVAFINNADTTQANGNLNYKWNFGDGTFSTEKNPAHIYPSAAEYQTMLTITDQNGCLSNTTRVIHTGDVYKISASINSGCKPLIATFKAGEGVFSTYQWDFGDGSSDTTPEPVHRFDKSGTFSVSVELTDSNYCKRVVTFKDSIQVIGPKADFIILSQSSACDSLLVVFQNNTVGADNYLWLFGDGFESAEFSPSHLYKKEGKMSVSLIATGNGCADTTHIPEAVQLGKPESSFLMNSNKGCLPFPVSFQNTSVNSDKYEWNFGDDSFSEEESPMHIFSSKDSFTVRLISWSFNGCTDTFQINTPVIVTGPETDFASNENNNCPPALFSFIDRSTGADKWEWNFGDSSFSDLKNPSHIYTKSGYYDIRLVTADSSGCTDTLKKPDFLHVQGPVVSFETSLNNSCGPAQALFNNKTTDANKYFWSFGDGNSSAIKNPTCFYSDAGQYVITLITKDTLIGCSDFYTDTINIYEMPLAEFSGALICEKEVNFMNQTSDSKPTWSYEWEFGDGFSSVESSIKHHFKNYGEYRVSLTVHTPEGCSDTKTEAQVIEPISMVNFSVQNVCKGIPAHFTEEVEPVFKNQLTQRNWFFGDGSFSHEINPEHVYVKAGEYNIALYVESESGCKDTILKNITVYSTPEPVIITGAICEDMEVVLKGDAGEDNEEILFWKWDSGNGEIISGKEITGIFDTPGEVRVTLTTETVNKCTANAVADIVIYPTPVAEFTTGKSEICGTDEVVYVNTSTGTNHDTRYFWTFGDGENSMEKSPVHIYKEPGNYTVTLNVQNTSGCTSLYMAEKGLRVNPMPEAGFTFRGEPTSRNPQVELINTGVNYSASGWTFGDGGTSEEINPVHIFTDTGNFLITLRVTGAGACSDTASEWIYVKPFTTLFMPNAFTPDNDGLNDIFKPSGNGIILNYSFKVFDRWGKELFSSNDFNSGWDGNVRGMSVPLGVYIWIISGKTLQNGEVLASGTVTVLR